MVHSFLIFVPAPVLGKIPVACLSFPRVRRHFLEKPSPREQEVSAAMKATLLAANQVFAKPIAFHSEEISHRAAAKCFEMFWRSLFLVAFWDLAVQLTMKKPSSLALD